MNNKRNALIAIVVALLLGLVFMQVVNSKRRSIKIGFVGGLTGRASDFAVSARDGFVLAIEEINHNGGIVGHQVEMLIRDNGQNKKKAEEVVQELIDCGVAVIVGPMTSAMATSMVPIANKNECLLISPVVGTSKLTGLDDYFLRTFIPISTEGEQLAIYAVEILELDSVVVLCDISNADYTKNVQQHFCTTFETLGGKQSNIVDFNSSLGVNFTQLVDQVIAKNADGLLIIANALDTAMICQQLEKRDEKLPALTGGWAVTKDLIRYGGESVEGIVLLSSSDRFYGGQQYQKFLSDYVQRFCYEPERSAVHTYSISQIIKEALEYNSDLSSLKESIIHIREFQGLQGRVIFDEYGDAAKEHLFMSVEGANFITLE